MAESIAFTKAASRATVYAELIPQIDSLLAGEDDVVANLANVSAVLKEAFGFFWIGFYLTRSDHLVLGPFQGPLACTRIPLGEGVCGHSFATKRTVIVPNVEEFPGHIACSSVSRSEIVVPIFDRKGDVAAVLDVDSDRLNDFSDVDAEGLEAIARLISTRNFH